MMNLGDGIEHTGTLNEVVLNDVQDDPPARYSAISFETVIELSLIKTD